MSSKAFVPFLATRLEAGDFRAVIDRRYPLEEIADAYRYVEAARKTGFVVIDVAPRDAEEVASISWTGSMRGTWDRF